MGFARDQARRLADRLPGHRPQAARDVARALRALVLGGPASVVTEVRSETLQPAPSDVARVPAQATTAPNGVRLWAHPGTYSSPIVNPDEVRGAGSDAPALGEIAGVPIDHDSHERIWSAWAPSIAA